MRNFWIALLAAAPLAAQTPIPKYEVKRATAPVTIDGKLDEAAWAGAAAPVALQFLWENQTGAKQKTSARVVWDAQALYLGYEADDADITARFLQRDDPTYQDDAVEFFVNPDLAHRPQATQVFEASLTGRNTSFGYPVQLCSDLPDPLI